MAETKLFKPEPLDGMTQVSASDESRKLDSEAAAFFRDRFSIEGADYYLTPGNIPWIAVSKSVQNQMAERSVQKETLAWYEPGIDFVDIYPQGSDGAAFAVVMARGSNPDADKLIGFYVLSAYNSPHSLH